MPIEHIFCSYLHCCKFVSKFMISRNRRSRITLKKIDCSECGISIPNPNPVPNPITRSALQIPNPSTVLSRWPKKNTKPDSPTHEIPPNMGLPASRKQSSHHHPSEIEKRSTSIPAERPSNLTQVECPRSDPSKPRPQQVKSANSIARRGHANAKK
jgi:hypothetical protein